MIEPSQQETELKCPLCGLANLHHYRVEIWERHEDADTGIHVMVLGVDRPTFGRGTPQVTVDSAMGGNPSDRRHGLRIFFWCEHCTDEIELALDQHKGTTFLRCASTQKKIR
jgi:hypothetical protein